MKITTNSAATQLPKNAKRYNAKQGISVSMIKVQGKYFDHYTFVKSSFFSRTWKMCLDNGKKKLKIVKNLTHIIARLGIFVVSFLL